MNWQVIVASVGPVIGTAGLLIGYLNYRRASRPKRLLLERVTDQPLSTPQQHGDWPGLSIHYNGEPLERPRIVTFRLVNIGQIEARPDDFDGDPSALTTGDAHIVAASVLHHRNAPDASAALVLKDAGPDRVSVEPVLLNPAESLEFRLLVDGHGASTGLAARAAGFRNFDRRPESTTRRPAVWLAVNAIAVLAGALAIWAAMNLFLEQMQDSFEAYPSDIATQFTESVLSPAPSSGSGSVP